jgi:hypothetical protein
MNLFQALVPESVPLVEALLHDLLATTHNLKVCKEQQKKPGMLKFSNCLKYMNSDITFKCVCF